MNADDAIPQDVLKLAAAEAEGFSFISRRCSEYEGDLEHDIAETVAEAIMKDRATRAARTEGVGVTVKALEWEGRGRKIDDVFANTSVGQYAAANIHGEYLALLRRITDDSQLEDLRIYPEDNTLEAAKAVAQADYEQRIRSALTTPATDEARRQAEIAELRAAELVEATDYYVGRLNSVLRGNVVRDLGEAEAAYNHACAALRSRAEEEAGR